MEKCLECQQECQQVWYISSSHKGITPFCSEECANNHAGNLVEQGEYVMGKTDPEHPHEMIIDTGTNES